MPNRFVKQEKESIIRGILREELDRSQRMEALYLKELESLPKGSLQVKVIRGREYLYRCFRDGKKVKSVFVPRDEAKKISESIQRRREIESSLKRLRADRELARKALR
jgi:cellulose biosynthesis protein BcsQ